MLQNGETRFATLVLSAADVALLLRSGTMRVSASLGNLSLKDDTTVFTSESPFKNLLNIEGKEALEFSYETFDPTDKETFPGYNSFIKLRAGSLRFIFMEHSIRELSAFGARLAQLKALYDAASQAAIQKASEVTRMRFDIAVKTPILILPREVSETSEVLCLRLGGITTHNEYGKTIDDDLKTVASLKGLNVSSGTMQQIEDAGLQMLRDTELTVTVSQRSEPRLKSDASLSEMEVRTQQVSLVVVYSAVLMSLFGFHRSSVLRMISNSC